MNEFEVQDTGSRTHQIIKENKKENFLFYFFGTRKTFYFILTDTAYKRISDALK